MSEAPENSRQPAARARLHLATMGCQMNRYDSSRLAGYLGGLGFVPVDDPWQADVILLNTCSVRHRAEHKVYSYLGQFRELKRRRPEVVLGVGGCVAQQLGEELLRKLPHLDLVFGPGALDRVPELIEDAAKGRRRALTPEQTGFGGIGPCLPARPGLKALVTVMQGCDNFCTYCVVPYVRGRERSRPAGEVLEEVAALAEAGVREVTLLGQNVNSYRDPGGGGGFAWLLERVAEVKGLWRIRFATSHPKDLSRELMEALAGIDKVMEELHLPAQAGSDRVLKAMNRRYSRARYLELVEELRSLVPELGLGGDLIVGFPGESEDDFRQTLSLVEEVRYDYLYSFKYSDRPFAKASRMAGKLDEPVKARRLRELQEMQSRISLELHRAQEGRRVQVLVEGPAKRGEGLMTGRSRAGQAVNFPGGEDLAGRLVEVEITEGRVNSLMGRVVQPPRGGQS